MDTASLVKLIKCLELTTSESDGEALNAIRKANNIKTKFGKSWNELLSPLPSHSSYNPYQYKPSPKPKPRKKVDHDPEIAQIFDDLEGKDMTPSAYDFIDSINSYFNRNGTLTEKQLEKLRNIHSRYCGV